MKRAYLIGAVIVVLVLAGAIYFAAQSGSQIATSQTSESSSQTLASKASTQSTLSTSQSSSSGSVSSSGGPQQGKFAMMATDPPMSASGVIKIYMKYNGASVHNTQSSGAGAWTSVNASGTLELTGLVNTTQTIASAEIQSGSYDAVKLDVTSVVVLYDNQNYTASVPWEQLTAHGEPSAGE